MINTMNDSYAIACTQVTKFLEAIPSDKINKIPKSVILYYKSNMDINYKFEIDKSKPIYEQDFSRKAAIIIIAIYKKYLANKEEIIKLNKALRRNTAIVEEKKAKLYKDDILQNTVSDVKNNNLKTVESHDLVVQKSCFIRKIWGFWKTFFSKK